MFKRRPDRTPSGFIPKYPGSSWSPGAHWSVIQSAGEVVVVARWYRPLWVLLINVPFLAVLAVGLWVAWTFTDGACAIIFGVFLLLMLAILQLSQLSGYRRGPAIVLDVARGMIRLPVQNLQFAVKAISHVEAVRWSGQGELSCDFIVLVGRDEQGHWVHYPVVWNCEGTFRLGQKIAAVLGVPCETFDLVEPRD